MKAREERWREGAAIGAAPADVRGVMYGGVRDIISRRERCVLLIRSLLIH